MFSQRKPYSLSSRGQVEFYFFSSQIKVNWKVVFGRTILSMAQYKSGKYEPFPIQLILLLFVHPHGPWIVSVLDDCGQHHWQGQEFSVLGCVADCQLIEGMASNLLECHSSLILSLKKATGVSFDSYSQCFECYAKHFFGSCGQFLSHCVLRGLGK